MPLPNVFDGKGVPFRFLALSLATSYISLKIHPKFPAIAGLAGYSAANYFAVAYFTFTNTRNSATLIGKEATTGRIPLWSYVVWWPFHLINQVFAFVAKNRPIGLATEICPNYYVGCWHAFELGKQWEAVLDLTCE